MDYLYEVVKYNKNLPAMVLMQDKPGYRCITKLHWHKEIELIYMMKGQLNIKVNGIEKIIKDNQLFLCNSEVIHVQDVKDQEMINRYLVVLISYDFIKKFFPDIHKYVFDTDKNKKAAEEIISAMKRLVELEENKTDFSDILEYQEILKICHILFSSCAVEKQHNFTMKTPNNFSYAKKVIEYVGLHYKEEITLESMAEFAGLSPTYFSKYFKNITGTSFTKYLNGVRLEYAIKDLITKNVSVTEAGLNNGFPNVKSFITNCKKASGLTPAQYRLKHPEY